MVRAKSADDYFQNAARWRDELNALRAIVRACGLTEEIKWGGPCYMLDGKNVVGIGAFKAYFGLWFFQGALLADEERVLVNAQEGVTRAQRQWRMASAKDIKAATVRAYVKEAAALVRAGKAIAPLRRRTIAIPPELSAALEQDKKTAAAFEAMTPGARRDYAAYIAEAKQPATKQRRLQRILPLVRAGGGLNDKYRRSKPG